MKDVSGHQFKADVDRFMAHLQKAINLRVEAEKLSEVQKWSEAHRVKGGELRKESEEMVRYAEYMVYEMIDNAMEEGTS